MTAGKTEAPPRVATQHGGAAPLAFLDVSECQTSAVECTKVTFHSPQCIGGNPTNRLKQPITTLAVSTRRWKSVPQATKPYRRESLHRKPTGEPGRKSTPNAVPARRLHQPHQLVRKDVGPACSAVIGDSMQFVYRSKVMCPECAMAGPRDRLYSSAK